LLNAFSSAGIAANGSILQLPNLTFRPKVELFSVKADDLRADLLEAIHMVTSFREAEMPGNGKALLRDATIPVNGNIPIEIFAAQVATERRLSSWHTFPVYRSLNAIGQV
jgi:hypothetical protein